MILFLADLATQAFITLPAVVEQNLGWFVAGAIVLVGLVGVGFRDVTRLSLKRIWAIASVCFTESLRRRVLWVTPLAILAVIIIAQLQKPVDAQDAVRQTIKVALFASGGLVAVVSIILACTNLPKEIENRVIYTVVSKPTTRLEIVAGKVLGFACVSAAILLIMGLFTWGYLHARAWSLERHLEEQLAAGRIDEINRPTFEHYVEAGLLHAKRLHRPERLDLYARLPEPDDNVRWILSFEDHEVTFPFTMSPEALVPPGQQAAAPDGLVLLLEMHYEQQPLTDEELRDLPQDPEDVEGLEVGPGLVAPADPEADAQRRLPPPEVTIQILDASGFLLVRAEEIGGGQRITVPPPELGEPVQAHVPAEVARRIVSELQKSGRIYVQVYGVTRRTEYGVPLRPVLTNLPAAASFLLPGTDRIIPIGEPPIFRGRPARYGQQVRGGAAGEGSVAVFAFRGASVNPDADGMVPMEIPRIGVERSGAQVREVDDITYASIEVRNLATGRASEPVIIAPENNRPSFFSVPAEALAGGDFDVIVRCISEGHFIGVRLDESMVVVAGRESFAFNLAKSMGILWLMSVLAIVVAVFTSTFLSWPIAVVLTVVILTGRWGVEQIADEGPGLGPRVATELGFDPAPARVVSESVEALNRFLHLTAAVLPDISQYPAAREIEQGVSVPPGIVKNAAIMTFGFGLPMLVLGFVFLKFKEVAP